MALQVADRIQQTGTANTTVSFTLSATTTGYQAFSPTITTGNTTYYSANDGTNWEVGIGTLTNATTLTRTTILSSSNSGSAVTFSGTVTVFCDYPASAFSSAFYTRTSFTATAGQTTFTVSYTVGYVEVYVNGVLLNGADYTATNGTSVVLAVGRATNDIVETIAFATGTVTPTNLSVGTSLVQGGTSGYVLYNNAGVVGNLATTGSGSVVLGTSPTIATPTITSLYGQNSNLVKTPYNGTGLIPGELIYRLDTASVGTATTSAQSILGVGVTVSGSTVYQFEASIGFSKTASNTVHNLAIGFGGTATINNTSYLHNLQLATSGFTTPLQTAGNILTAYIQTSALTPISGVNTSQITIYWMIFLKGTISINAGGTLIPQYQTSASVGPYTTAFGSYFKLSPMSASGSNTSIGTWA
jgi:hypothetical protein